MSKKKNPQNAGFEIPQVPYNNNFKQNNSIGNMTKGKKDWHKNSNKKPKDKKADNDNIENTVSAASAEEASEDKAPKDKDNVPKDAVSEDTSKAVISAESENAQDNTKGADINYDDGNVNADNDTEYHNKYDDSANADAEDDVPEKTKGESDDLAEIFDENTLDYDDTIFSDETVVLIQYMPEGGYVIETEYGSGDFSGIIANQLEEITGKKPINEEVTVTEEPITEQTGNVQDEPHTDEAGNAETAAQTKAEAADPDIEAKLKKRKRRKIIRRIVKIIILLLCIACIVAGAAILYFYDVLNSLIFKELGKPKEPSSSVSEIIFDIPKTPTNPSQSMPADPSSDVSSEAVSEWTIEISDGSTLLNDPMILNVMLFGSDTRFAGSAGNSDTMILMSLDNRHRKIKFTSFMRDTWINIPGYGPNKMNAAYSFDGPRLAIETIERNYGINIDRYAIVDFSSFIEIINILGGIDIELSDFEIDYINMQMFDNHQTSDRHYLKDKAGIVHLNGLQALWHARNRDSYFSDFDRTDRQRQVINAIMKKYENASISTILDTVAKAGPKITTNLKKSEITALVKNAPTYLSYKREQYNVPDIYSDNMMIDNEFPTQYGPLSVLLIPDWNRARRDLASFVFEDSFAGYVKPQRNSSAAW